MQLHVIKFLTHAKSNADISGNSPQMESSVMLPSLQMASKVAAQWRRDSGGGTLHM